MCQHNGSNYDEVCLSSAGFNTEKREEWQPRSQSCVASCFIRVLFYKCIP